MYGHKYRIIDNSVLRFSVTINFMSQVSKKKLDKDLEKEMFNQFWYYLGKINNAQKSSDFFSDFFTETEKVVFAKRFMIAILLYRGKNSVEIKNTLHVSNSNIQSVSSWLKYSKPETQKIINNISNEKNIEKVLDKIDDIFDHLPPKIFTNWSNEYNKRNTRINERFTRKSLR